MLISLPILGSAQPLYDGCNNALELCPNEQVSLSNVGAFATGCVNCEDDFTTCFTPDNTIWCTFTTNASGGDVTVNFSNLVFETNANQDNELQATIIEAAIPCDASSYTFVGDCASNETGNFAISALGLTANTTYYVVIDGDNNGAGITTPAECTFDVILSGPGVDRTNATGNVLVGTTDACENEIVYFQAQLNDCPDTSDITWYINGVAVSSSVDTVFQTADLNDGDVVSFETSCYESCPITVSAQSPPITIYTVTVDAGEDITIAPGAEVQLNGSTTANDFYWEPTFEVSISDQLDPFVSPSTTTVFSLTATENGCTKTDYMTVTVLTGLEVPNTFSPNGDGVNDTWVIDGIDAYPDNTVEIYSRWGQRVYQTSSYSDVKTWDGTRNKELPEGVYFYVIELNDSDETRLKGTITLLR